MKSFLQKSILFFAIVFLFTSCEVIEGIFKAGMGVGIFIVVVIVGLVVYLISKFSKKEY